MRATWLCSNFVLRSPAFSSEGAEAFNSPIVARYSSRVEEIV